MNYPCQMSLDLFPTMHSMVDVIRYIESKLPIESPNELFPLLMTYHNTLLKELGDMECKVSGNPLEKFLKQETNPPQDPELRKYVLYREYPVILLQDIPGQAYAGTKLNVMRVNHQLFIMKNDATVILKGAIEGTHFMLTQPIPEQQVLPL